MRLAACFSVLVLIAACQAHMAKVEDGSADEIADDRFAIHLATKIRIMSSPIHGLGVFATADIEEDEEIEECPFLVLPIEPDEDSTLLIDHRFTYPNGPAGPDSLQAVVLGWCSIYNHNDDNNAYFTADEDRETYRIFATRPIKAGEEIFTHYGAAYWNARSYRPLTAAPSEGEHAERRAEDEL